MHQNREEQNDPKQITKQQNILVYYRREKGDEEKSRDQIRHSIGCVCVCVIWNKHKSCAKMMRKLRQTKNIEENR